MVIDPLELLGKGMDFQMHIVQCLGTKWLKEDPEWGMQVGHQPALQGCYAQTTYLLGARARESFLILKRGLLWNFISLLAQPENDYFPQTI